MGPLVAIVSSSLKRAAVLIEKGVSPAKALRQASNELIDYEEVHSIGPAPNRIIDLGLESRPTVRAL